MMPVRNPATVVVLEKNAAAQELIDQALRESGDRILVTGDPNEALGLARRVRIDLLVSGVFVDQAAQTIVARLRSIEPSLQVLYITGPNGPGYVHPDEGMTLRTPFSLEELRNAVAVALGHPA